MNEGADNVVNIGVDFSLCGGADAPLDMDACTGPNWTADVALHGGADAALHADVWMDVDVAAVGDHALSGAAIFEDRPIFDQSLYHSPPSPPPPLLPFSLPLPLLSLSLQLLSPLPPHHTS